MVSWLTRNRFSPIGVDVGSRSVKLVQFNADYTRLMDAAVWDVSTDGEPLTDSQRCQQLAEAICKARVGRNFRGSDAVLCLTGGELFLQNVRLPKADAAHMTRLVRQEVGSRLPFSVEEAELQFLDAAEVRQGDAALREVIVMACHRPALERTLEVVEQAGMKPLAVDVEPAALLRSCLRQFRRDEDRNQRTLLVHIGFSRTAVLIAQGEQLLFIKYLDVGGRQMDEAVSRHLNMDLQAASALRRHNGDRRSDQQDPEIAHSVSDAVRPILERLLAELAMCVRYHSVTFRGQPVARLVLGGGEATPQMLEPLGSRLDLKCELSEPLRGFQTSAANRRAGQWDVAAGLALRQPGNES